MLDAGAARALIEAREKGLSRLPVSLDLGLTESDVSIESNGVRLADGTSVGWPDIEEIAESGERCFAVQKDGSIWPVGVFSETTGWYRSLIRTGGTPTTLVGGFTMHRIKDSDPLDDTREKNRALRPVTGRVLDTATGLGYTAIEASRTADHVLSVEVDPAAVEIIRYNPWSHELLTRDNIIVVIADVYELIRELGDESFDRVIHDPPTLSLAGELYSEAFYRELYRVLDRRGRLFHYIGDPSSRSGRRTTDGVIRRLQAAGFERVRRVPNAYGVVAYR
ncbi:methyltransferase domain-containing protein [soil metagenome]